MLTAMQRIDPILDGPDSVCEALLRAMSSELNDLCIILPECSRGLFESPADRNHLVRLVL